jgi:hypothetical protein
MPSLAPWTLAAAAAVAAAASGCGRRPQAEPRTSGQLELPPYATDGDPMLGLTAGETRQFKGTAVIFRDDPAPEGLALVADAARRTRLTKADWLGFEQDQVQPVATESARLRDAIRATDALAHQDKSRLAAQAQAARGWFAHQVAALKSAGEIDDAGEAKALEVFGAYCEAKLWELATSGAPAAAAYKTRPTPLQLCEDHYTAAHLLTGPDCAAASGGKSYFGCLWREGVLKTRFYIGKYDEAFPNVPESKAAALLGWIDSGSLATELASDEHGFKITNAAMDQTRLWILNPWGKNYRDAFVPIGGTPEPAPELTLAGSTPAMVLQAVEDHPQVDTPLALRMFGAAGATLTSMQKALLDDVKAIGVRAPGEPSVNDYLFDEPLVPMPAPVSLPVVKENPSFAFIFDAIAPELKAKLTDLARALTANDAKLASQRAAAADLFTVFTDSMRDGAIAASSQDVSVGLWINASLALDAASPASGLARARFRLDDATGSEVTGCWDGALLQAAPCGDGEQLTVDHETDSGRLLLTMPIAAPEALGFKLAAPGEPGSGDPFSVLDPAGLAGRTLELELWPGTIGEAFVFYSGKLRIIADGGAVEHEGGVSLLGD